MSTTKSLTTDQRAATGDYVTGLQQIDGAFSWTADTPPDLGATSTALRVLKECETPIERRDNLEAYVVSCFDASISAFTMTPGGERSLPSIAQGHVAVHVLGLPGRDWTGHLAETVDPYVKTAQDAWVAGPFLNTLGIRPTQSERWAALINGVRNEDGTWGTGGQATFQSAGNASALLLMGAPLDHPEPVSLLLTDTQTAAGGWSTDGDEPTLEGTYHVARALHALHIQPDRDAVNKFLAACRRKNGSYAASPGAVTGDLVNTYFALTIDRWINTPAAPGIN